MEIAIIGETTRNAKGGAKASSAQPGSDSFDLAMAALMALLAPNSGDSPPAPGEAAPQYDWLPGTPAFAVLNTDGTAVGDVTADGAQTSPQTAWIDEKLPSIPILNAEPAPENFTPGQAATMPDTILNSNVAVEGKPAGAAPEKTAAEIFTPVANARAAVTKIKTVTETAPGKLNDALSGKIIAGEVSAASVLNAESALQKAELEPESPAPVQISAMPDNPTKGLGTIETAGEHLSPFAGAAGAAPAKTAAGIFASDANARTAAAQKIANDTLPGKIAAGETSAAGGAKNEGDWFNNILNAAGTQPDSAKIFEHVSLPDLKEVVLQEIKHIYDTRKGGLTQIQIKLEPENLGKLTIKLSYSNGALNAQFYTASDHVRDILEGSLQQLRESLGRQELTLNQAFVFVGGENSGSGAGNQTAFGNGRAGFFPHNRLATAVSQSNLEPDSYFPADADCPGVNYLI